MGFNKEYFTGLPIPSSGITIAAFVLAYYDNGFTEPYASFIIPLVIVLSFLMVSKVKYDTLPKPSIKPNKEETLPLYFHCCSNYSLVITSGKALFYIFVFIILFGIFRYIFNKYF